MRHIGCSFASNGFNLVNQWLSQLRSRERGYDSGSHGLATVATGTDATAICRRSESSMLLVLFDHVEADERGNVLDAVAEVTERRDPVHAVLIGVYVAENLVGVN